MLSSEALHTQLYQVCCGDSVAHPMGMTEAGQRSVQPDPMCECGVCIYVCMCSYGVGEEVAPL